MEINEIAKNHSAWVDEMNWHNKSVLEALALICSEVGEAVNECRGEKPTEHFGSELADIILRTLDLAYTEGIDINNEILKKMELNRSRGTRGRVI
jgi:NTP pyrophosphatase (non-canonical NTP hydrolase)